MERPSKEMLMKLSELAYSHRFDWTEYGQCVRLFKTSAAIREQILKYACRALDAWEGKIKVYDPEGREVHYADEIARAAAADEAEDSRRRNGNMKYLRCAAVPEDDHIITESDFAELGASMYGQGLREEEFIALYNYMKMPKVKRDRITAQLAAEGNRRQNGQTKKPRATATGTDGRVLSFPGTGRKI